MIIEEKADYLERIADAIGMSITVDQKTRVITGEQQRTSILSGSFVYPRTVFSGYDWPDLEMAMVMVHLLGDLNALVFNNVVDGVDGVDLVFFAFSKRADNLKTVMVDELAKSGVSPTDIVNTLAPVPVLYVRRVAGIWTLIEDDRPKGDVTGDTILDDGKPTADNADIRPSPTGTTA